MPNPHLLPGARRSLGPDRLPDLQPLSETNELQSTANYEIGSDREGSRQLDRRDGA
jgi:hypothetical protein